MFVCCWRIIKNTEVEKNKYGRTILQISFCKNRVHLIKRNFRFICKINCKIKVLSEIILKKISREIPTTCVNLLPRYHSYISLLTNFSINCIKNSHFSFYKILILYTWISIYSWISSIIRSRNINTMKY